MPSLAIRLPARCHQPADAARCFAPYFYAAIFALYAAFMSAFMPLRRCSYATPLAIFRRFCAAAAMLFSYVAILR